MDHTMNRIVQAVEDIGDVTIKSAYSWGEALHFGFTCIMHLFLPKSYNSAMVSVIIRQIYFTDYDKEWKDLYGGKVDLSDVD